MSSAGRYEKSVHTAGMDNYQVKAMSKVILL